TIAEFMDTVFNFQNTAINYFQFPAKVFHEKKKIKLAAIVRVYDVGFFHGIQPVNKLFYAIIAPIVFINFAIIKTP
ncbi:hypothetical protein Q6283_29090, partial [Klebsiella pneumoniae]|uniref:hypothetical protein n=1 Tax=Klebsiella pneumoniae TaxID=573 RepID=UPI0027322563